VQYQIGALTDIGQKRQQNQDSIGVFPELGLFVVADGMGGHRGGEIASALAVEAIPKFVGTPPMDIESSRQLVCGSIEEANRKIFDKSRQDPKLHGMGTTATVLFFRDGKLYLGQVGDSRCYLLQEGAIWQLTRDHSLVEEKFRAGIISREEIKTDSMRNVITRSVGFEENVQIDCFEMEVHPGDLFVACSDGLSGPLGNQEILETVENALVDGDPQKAADGLIARANQNGGEDNISSILVQVQSVT